VADKKSPFASLEALRESLPPGERPVAHAPSTPDPFDAKLVVARSKKGRGGKTVTIVSGVRDAARETTMRELKKALGCGATIEDATIVLQGDVSDRVKRWLEERGARRVVIGS
jgi:translation initiation factor 1